MASDSTEQKFADTEIFHMEPVREFGFDYIRGTRHDGLLCKHCGKPHSQHLVDAYDDRGVVYCYSNPKDSRSFTPE